MTDEATRIHQHARAEPCALCAPTRLAIIHHAERDVLASYLPANYRIAFKVTGDCRLDHKRANPRYPDCFLVAGEDVAGWTLDAYVLPRLASGLYTGEEITL
jgi:hypothetical protein